MGPSTSEPRAGHTRGRDAAPGSTRPLVARGEKGTEVVFRALEVFFGGLPHGRRVSFRPRQGIVHRKTIELAVDPGLQDGEVVEVVIRRVKEPRTRGEGIRTTAGALGRMPPNADDEFGWLVVGVVVW